MRSNPWTLFLATLLVALGCFPAAAQQPASDDDNASERVEESDEAFRRRMELEDARHRDPGYTQPAGAPPKKQEKIDALPPASRDNIRDQLVDVIMANDAWEPSDALEDYPYEPTEAARQDHALLDQEQAAWDEQIEKYHQREAEAFGAPRSAAGAAGDSGDEGTNPGTAGGPQGTAGGPGGEAGRAGAAGSYSPYASDRGTEGDEPATAGAQQSALDFLRRLQGQPATPSAAIAGEAEAATDEVPDQASVLAANPDGSDRRSESESGFESAAQGGADSASESETAREIPGIIAIEDLDKLEGTANEDETDERDDSTPPG